jgi:hypothetical protein
MFAARFENISPIDGCEAGTDASCTFGVWAGIVHRRALVGSLKLQSAFSVA